MWALRDKLGLTGTKFGCGMALCGGCTALSLRRSEALLAAPPPADWDGVHVARTK